MSKQDNPFTVNIGLKLDKTLMSNLFHALLYHVANDIRVRTQVRLKSNELQIIINANDLNMLIGVNNSVMQSIKMLESINQYE